MQYPLDIEKETIELQEYPNIEPVDIAEYFPYCLGNAIKYAWEAGMSNDLKHDLNHCLWYVNRAYDNAEDQCAYDDNSSIIAGRMFEKLNPENFTSYELQYDILDDLVSCHLILAKKKLEKILKKLEE